ncbi:MAG: rRNA maturation RNase YbeY [Planctomycetota bacterium]|nr:rRNA maturation RNase YbeY [Planctomycetota bacterium]
MSTFIKEDVLEIGSYKVNVSNQNPRAKVDQERLKQGIQLVLRDYEVKRAVIGLAIVTDDTIQKMNKRFLDHDYATDVLSFPLSDSEHETDVLEGEIAISFDTAQKRSGEFGWGTENELLLYAVHGALHLVGLSDQTREERTLMRRAEQKILSQMNITVPQTLSDVTDENSNTTASNIDNAPHCPADTLDQQ